MLKRLELIGFKSFADKTQFDFPAGVTAVVGPNGSGKSNVVDAVRWILGEQSAKSLRGGEMADVIFNGSTSRRSLGMAEVTMTFDNRRRVLTTDADEVQITRRVYRSGEGEYLINQQPARLKDIKDLFLGSGAGADAYCIIEQGKVDVLLQASTKERRTIFEEAAGISRFKAKKIETLRRLERVDQNLQRLQDIIEEVEKQLRSVKLQAAKAQRYQEYSGRLKELRVELGLVEYHQLSEQLQEKNGALETLKQNLAERNSQVAAWESETRRLEEFVTRLEQGVHDQEGCLAAAKQQIASEESTLNREWAFSLELEADLAGTRKQVAELNARVNALGEAAAQAAGERQGVETQGEEERQRVKALVDDLAAVVGRLETLQQQIQADQAEHLEQMRQAARLHNDAVSYQAQVDNLRRERDRLLLKTEQATEHLASLDLELQELSQADEVLQTRLSTARQNLSERRQERDRLRQLRDETAQVIADLKAQRTGLTSRIEVLEGLERSHEGLGTGVREVVALLAEARENEADADGLAEVVIGMTADLVRVRHEYAPLIDLALGDRAQRFLVRDGARLSEILKHRGRSFSGRVSFLPLSAPGGSENGSPVRPPRLLELSNAVRARAPLSPAGVPAHAGVVALAEQVMTVEAPELADLPSQLLGRTLIVRDLDTARAIAAHSGGFRFVTLQGELLETDGSLTVGTHHAETGILSRKSELRELREQVVTLDRRISEVEHDLVDLRDRVNDLESQANSLQQEIDVLAEQAADLRSRLGQRHQQRQGLHEEVSLSRTEISGVEREIQGLAESLDRSRSQAEAADRKVQELQSRLEGAEKEIRRGEHQRHLRQQEVTQAQVSLAKVEERLAAVRAKHRQIQADWEQRKQEQAQLAQQLQSAQSRLTESQRTMLNASAALASWYLHKEAAESKIGELTRERDVRRQERQTLTERLQTIQGEWRTLQDEAHQLELETNDFHHRRDTLADRLREDYQLELAELYQKKISDGQSGTGEPGCDGEPGCVSTGSTANSPGPNGTGLAISGVGLALNTAAANEEIAELRRKLSRLGSVNLDSLQELNDLEARASNLQVQFDDLTSAKRSLEEIINTINQDSRRLFTEAFTSIRTHFQELFRKLFGGGMADIILEDDTDILESGIEIIARPPGKELRSISLMSGGEKTMTAVALLLSIFRSKPSPFCLLDEVDAALDEANIGRFTAVLREFLDQSQFIIITHSKKTMAVADVLYGVTMQESGVSKRVAVRFDDWVEEPQGPHLSPSNGNGHAAQAAIPADDSTSSPGG